MAIERAKNISLYDVGNDFKTWRSFHLWNLTIRDLFPVVFWCHWETFDLNTMSDRAYFPKKVIFQGEISDILLDKTTNYVATSSLLCPPQIGKDKEIQYLIDESFEKSKTLWWFWMRINESLHIWEFTTFSKKIAKNDIFARDVLEKINQRVDNESLQYLWSRYITQDGVLLNLDSVNWEFLVYKDDQWQIITIHRNDLSQQSINFFKNRSLLSDSNINREDVMSQCQWPIFSNEMNAILIYMIDAKNNQSGKVFHVWWQAMYWYIKWGNFSNKFKQLLQLIDDDHDITNGIQLEWMEVLPAHFFRMAWYDKNLLEELFNLFQTFDSIDDTNQKKWNLFKELQDYRHIEIQSLMNNINILKTTQEELVKNIMNHHEIQSMPAQTLKDGTLNDLYQSQLDMYYQIKNNNFDPHKEWMFLWKQPIERIQKVVDKILTYKK